MSAEREIAESGSSEKKPDARVLEFPKPGKIVIDRLSKTFEGAQTSKALDDISLSVADGEFVCIVGPSGCGKSTALRIVAGLEKPSTGSVTILASKPAERPLNTMVFQEHGLFPWLTVFDNIAFGLEMRGIRKKERIRRVEPFLELIGIAKFRNHYPHQLSGGMKQRASLARAFVNDPEILLMDEPFAALDAQNRVIMQQELLRIWEHDKKTVLFITHSIDEAIGLADRIVVMTSHPGRICEIIPIEFARPRDLAELRGDPNFGALHVKVWRILEAEVAASRQPDTESG